MSDQIDPPRNAQFVRGRGSWTVGAASAAKSPPAAAGSLSDAGTTSSDGAAGAPEASAGSGELRGVSTKFVFRRVSGKKLVKRSSLLGTAPFLKSSSPNGGESIPGLQCGILLCMATVERIMTAEELLRATDLGRCELIHGELIMMSPAGSEHGAIAAEVAAILRDFVKPRGLGVVLGAETGFKITRIPTPSEHRTRPSFAPIASVEGCRKGFFRSSRSGGGSSLARRSSE